MRTRRERGVWREGNEVTLLPEARRFMPALLEAVENAQESLLIELYLMESGVLANRAIEALVSASRRGVDVHLVLDGFGSMGLSSADRQRLTDNGVWLRDFNPLGWNLTRNISRDHRKLVVVDQRIAFTGGFGAVDAFLNSWFEVAIRVEGPVVADWVRLFLKVWESPLTRGGEQAPRITPRPHSPASVGGVRGRVIWGQGYRFQAIRYSLLVRSSSARHRLWLCTPYFAPTRSLRRRLRSAARRGVDVRLLLPGQSHDHPGIRYASQRFFMRLLRAGVRIYEFQPCFIHAKFVLADDWVSLGSCNFDHWSLHWNLEANQEIESALLAAEVQQLFEQKFQVSQEITLEEWMRRPWWMRIRTMVFGILDGWLTRLR